MRQPIYQTRERGSTLFFLALLSFTAFCSSPAFAAPPIISSPTDEQARDGITLTEGDLIVIPFDVFELDNDVVDYSVGYLVGGVAQQSLPRGAAFEIDPKTAEKRFVWWPDFKQAGAYDLRFRAVDEKGAATEKTITLTVTNKTGAPAVAVYNNIYNPALLQPPAKVTLHEIDLFSVRIVGKDPEGDPLKFSISGDLAFLTLTGDPDNPNARQLVMYTSYNSAGTYNSTITATDPGGNTTETPLTLEVRQVWTPWEWNYVTPSFGPQQGSVPILRGTVPLNATFLNRDGSPPSGGAVQGASFRYMLETPGGPQPISPVLKNDYRFTWDSTLVPDGTYVLSTEIIDGPGDIDRVRPLPRSVVVDNVPGVITGSQSIPLPGNHYGSKESQPVIDWFTSSGRRQVATARPYPTFFSSPVFTRSNPDQYLSMANWYVEPLGHAVTIIYETIPTLYSTREGHLYADALNPKHGITSEEALPAVEREDFWDGGRNQAEVSPFATYVNDPVTDGWMGIDIAGRVYSVSQDGTIATVAGRVLQGDTVPMKDHAASLQEINAQKAVVGTFEGNLLFKNSNDLAFDPRDAKVIYVADTGNQRIARIDLRGTTPVITTYAGTPGQAGYVDGPALQAKLNKPYSVAVASDGTVYVGDRGNKAVRAISPDGNTIATVVGTNNPAIPSPTVVSPQSIRLDSKGNIIAGDPDPGGSAIFRIDMAGRQVVKIHDIPSGDGKWIWLDVDRYGPVNSQYGNVGPKDDVLWALATGGGNTFTGRISADGSRYERLFGNGVGGATYGVASTVNDGLGHYPWAIAIHDTQAKILGSGVGTLGIAQARPILPQEPAMRTDIGR